MVAAARAVAEAAAVVAGIPNTPLLVAGRGRTSSPANVFRSLLTGNDPSLLEPTIANGMGFGHC